LALESDFAQFTLEDTQYADAGTLHKIYRHLYWKLTENSLKTATQNEFPIRPSIRNGHEAG
jgi:hypothetical protein